MGNSWNENYVELSGVVQEAPAFSHKNHEDNYYFFPLRIDRLSGAADTINIVIPEKLFSLWDIHKGGALKVLGELRTYNNKSGQGNKLVITVFARRLARSEGQFENIVTLSGTICKLPVLRRTPMGRDICDLMLAVNRKYGHADYLPCISWGQAARESAHLTVGSKVNIQGRIQSRCYIKVEDGASMERVAFEVSIMKINILDV